MKISNRRCTNPTKIKGIDMPIGLVVRVDHFALHFDQELWGPHDPNEFYPLRLRYFLLKYFCRDTKNCFY
jgi:hypothetical protein